MVLGAGRNGIIGLRATSRDGINSPGSENNFFGCIATPDRMAVDENNNIISPTTTGYRARARVRTTDHREGEPERRVVGVGVQSMRVIRGVRQLQLLAVLLTQTRTTQCSRHFGRPAGRWTLLIVMCDHLSIPYSSPSESLVRHCVPFALE